MKTQVCKNCCIALDQIHGEKQWKKDPGSKFSCVLNFSHAAM